MRFLFFVLSFLVLMSCAQPLWAVPVTDGLVLWLDATDSATLFKDEGMTQPSSPGDDVVAWSDKSGNAHHAVADFFSPPTYATAVMNGQDAVRFDGNEASGMIVSDDLFLERPYTAFIVNQYWGDVRGRTLQARDGPNWLHGLWAGNFGSYAEAWIHNEAAVVDFPYVLDTTGDFSGSTLFVNGRDFTRNPDPVGEPGFLSFASAGQFGGEVSDADVSEVVIYDRVLTNDELTQVRNHLYEKYSTEPVPDLSVFQNLLIDPSGHLGTFTSPTDGVDFEGEFVYAIDVGGLGDLTVGDADFTDGTVFGCCQDGADVFSEDRQIDPWYNDGDFGDADLETVMQSIRWSAAPQGIDVTLDVEPGTPYKLQLLFAEECCDRGFDIFVEDQLVVDNFNVQLVQGGIGDPKGVVYSLNVIPSDNELEIVLVGPNEFAPDNNPILQGVTLEIGDALLGDFNGNGVHDAEDIDLLSAEVQAGTNTPRFDLNADAAVNSADRDIWVEDLANTYYGDSNLDGEFGSGDLVSVFSAGKYETGQAAGWADGDWSGDALFDSSDLVKAFQGGGFEVGPRPMANGVPEPTTAWLMAGGLLGLGALRRRSTRRSRLRSDRGPRAHP